MKALADLAPLVASAVGGKRSWAARTDRSAPGTIDET
jgi:hypothetical protein